MLLCEELKAVLAPTEIASLKGDYKSGKLSPILINGKRKEIKYEKDYSLYSK